MGIGNKLKIVREVVGRRPSDAFEVLGNGCGQPFPPLPPGKLSEFFSPKDSHHRVPAGALKLPPQIGKTIQCRWGNFATIGRHGPYVFDQIRRFDRVGTNLGTPTASGAIPDFRQANKILQKPQRCHPYNFLGT